MTQKLIGNPRSAFEFVKRLGFSFWQKGDYPEARAVLRDTLGKGDLTVPERVALYILLGMVERSSGNDGAALEAHREGYPLLQACEDVTLRAKFHNGMAATYWHLREFDRALEEFTAVRVLMEEVGDAEGYARAGNNIAQVLIDANNASAAYEYIDAALKVCTDQAERSQILNTLARACLAEGKKPEARRAALESVELSMEGENEQVFYEHLATFLLTREVPMDIDKLKHAIDAEEIHKALIEAKGSVYRAAPRVNLTCEGLRQKLINQHPELLYLRTPQRKSPTSK